MGRIVVTLVPTDDGGTLLELNHLLPSPPDHWEEFGPGAVGIGWEIGADGTAAPPRRPRRRPARPRRAADPLDDFCPRVGHRLG